MFMLCFVSMYRTYITSRLMEYSKTSPTHSILRKRIFFLQLRHASMRFIFCVSVYTAYETNESKIIWAYWKDIFKKKTAKFTLEEPTKA